MKQTIKIGLLLLVSFCCTSLQAKEYDFASAVTMEIQLPPQEPQIFTNFLLWKVKGTCVVVSDEQSNPIYFRMQKSHGTLNNVDFAEGDSLYMTAENGQSFDLSADARARIEITNLGNIAFTLRCTNA